MHLVIAGVHCCLNTVRRSKHLLIKLFPKRTIPKQQPVSSSEMGASAIKQYGQSSAHLFQLHMTRLWSDETLRFQQTGGIKHQTYISDSSLHVSCVLNLVRYGLLSIYPMSLSLSLSLSMRDLLQQLPSWSMKVRRDSAANLSALNRRSLNCPGWCRTSPKLGPDKSRRHLVSSNTDTENHIETQQNYFTSSDPHRDIILTHILACC